MIGRWRHVKRGTIYEVLGAATMQTEDWGRDDAKVVVYRGDADGRLWVRPLEEFMDGRFEALVRSPVFSAHFSAGELEAIWLSADPRLRALEFLFARYFVAKPALVRDWLSALDEVDELRGGRSVPLSSSARSI